MNLDEQQKQAVYSNAKNIIVVAGAGSGKTRVITERIRWLLQTGTQANAIVAITFTNMAAQEMRARLSDIPRSGDAFVGTIHSFANKLLKNKGKPYEIYTEEKQNSYMLYLCKKYAKHLTFDRYLEYQQLKREIVLGKQDTDVLEQFTSGERFELGMFLHHRQPSRSDDYPQTVWMLAKLNNVVTFDELLKLSGEYFESIGGSIQHLLVDELQDIGNLEYDFLKALNADNNFWVGDDWQSIYGFKGANPKIFMSLVESSEWERNDLINNYRCCEDILRTATSIIQQVPKRIEKAAVCLSTQKGSFITSSKYMLERFVDEEIVTPSMKDAWMLSDWFILVRYNKDLEEVAKRLTNMQVPFSTFRKADIDYQQLQDIMSMNTIKLLTIHMAKGLEADNVLMWGNFPLNPSKYLMQPEERRIMYVGATRAKNKLIILT